MGIQDEIEEKLKQGYTPNQLIEMGYKRSTTYKVYNTIKSYETPTNPPTWIIENINPYPLRQLNGKKIQINFTFKNNSEKEMYLYRIGIRPEWMEPNQWFSQEVKDLIKPNQKRFFSFSLSIPQNTPLGEYELLFGIEAQYLPVSCYTEQSMQTQWSEPVTIHVKYPLTNIKIFISYSTQDLQIVRELEKRLDNYGYQTIIAEDIQKPGVELEEKIKTKIRESTIVLAILTEDSIRSKWVILETEYAHQINKPLIPLKEKNLHYEGTVEWVEFSKSDDPDRTFQKVMEAIKNTQPNTSSLAPILGIGILAFIAALAFGSSD